MNPEHPSATRNEKAFRFFSYTLVFLIMASVALTMGSIIRTVLPDWHSGIISGVLLFIVIDRLYTYPQLKSLTVLSSEWAIYIGAQWLLILLVIRFLLSYANGMESFRADLSLFVRGYIGDLFTPEFVVSLLLALLAWYITGRFLEVLDEIGLDPVLAWEEGSAPVQTEAVSAHQRLVGLIFSLGIVLVILTAVARVNLQAIASNTEGLPRVEFSRLSGGEAGALLYFVFGLALLSLSRLMSLRTHWNRIRIPVSSRDLTRQWGIYSLFFFLILAVVVSLLPAGDSLGLFSVLGALFDFLLSVLFFIGQLIISLILLLVSLPFLLAGQTAPPLDNPPPPPLPVLPPVEPAAPIAANEMWSLIRSILLWGGLAVIILFSLIHFVRQHGSLRAALRKSRLANWLALAWQWLYRNAEKTGGALSRALADGWQTIVARLEGNRILPRPGLIRLRSLDPRQRIYFFYLAMIRRGGEQGVTRKPSQTPSEYAATLEKALPSADQDIDSITAAFNEARYSRQEVDFRKVDVVKATWGRIRKAMQSKAKREREAKKLS